MRALVASTSKREFHDVKIVDEPRGDFRHRRKQEMRNEQRRDLPDDGETGERDNTLVAKAGESKKSAGGRQRPLAVCKCHHSISPL